jgi:hypothetical protein
MHTPATVDYTPYDCARITRGYSFVQRRQLADAWPTVKCDGARNVGDDSTVIVNDDGTYLMGTRMHVRCEGYAVFTSDYECNAYGQWIPASVDNVADVNRDWAVLTLNAMIVNDNLRCPSRKSTLLTCMFFFQLENVSYILFSIILL